MPGEPSASVLSSTLFCLPVFVTVLKARKLKMESTVWISGKGLAPHPIPTPSAQRQGQEVLMLLNPILRSLPHDVITSQGLCLHHFRGWVQPMVSVAEM